MLAGIYKLMHAAGAEQSDLVGKFSNVAVTSEASVGVTQRTLLSR